MVNDGVGEVDPLRWTAASVNWLSYAADEIAGENMVSAGYAGEVLRGAGWEAGGCSGQWDGPGCERVAWWVLRGVDYKDGEWENYEQSPPPTQFTMALRGVEWEFRVI